MIQQEFQVFTSKEQEFINHSVLTSRTEWLNAKVDPYTSDKPWRFYDRTILEPEVDDHPMFVLRLVQRNDDKKGTVVSPYWETFETIFHRVRKKMGLPFSHVLRSSINMTWHQLPMHGVPHKDHYTIDHYNMILHLTPISQGGTFIFDENKTILTESSPSVWSATAFEGLWHAQGFCAPGETRAICVITWQ
jgi:hypothetical protein